MKKFLVMLCMLTCIFGLTACDSEQTLKESDIANAEKAELISANMALPYLCTFSDDAMADEYLEEYTKEEMAYVAESMFYTFLSTYGSDLQSAGISYVYVDGAAFLSGITSFNSAFDTIGELKEIGEVSSEVKGEEIVVTVDVVGSKGNATAEFIYKNDIFLTMEAAALNPSATMGDMMTKAGLNTLLGMGTVFTVLILISLLISAMGLIPKLQGKAKKKETVETSKEVKTKTEVSVDNTIAQIIEKEELSDNLELVAVIAAAIAAYEGAASTDGFVVRSVRRIRR
ncbi:MAG: OadG family protein [Lachnospiraceae bacterium]|nr:OadG family protein [Lachnospiraceae bacterium]